MGLVFSMATVGLVFAHRYWRTVKLQLDNERLFPLLRYGLPLAGTLILSYIVSVSDRFLIAWLLDEAQAGIYAAGYDLANQPVILLMSIVNLAAYPLIVQVWEHEGVESAQAYLVRNLRLLLVVGVPATVGLAMLARPFGELVLGASFHSASAVIPLIALGTLLDGLRVYHTDLAFHLGQRTTRQLQIISWVFFNQPGAQFALDSTYGNCGRRLGHGCCLWDCAGFEYLAGKNCSASSVWSSRAVAHRRSWDWNGAGTLDTHAPDWMGGSRYCRVGRLWVVIVGTVCPTQNCGLNASTTGNHRVAFQESGTLA